MPLPKKKQFIQEVAEPAAPAPEFLQEIKEPEHEEVIVEENEARRKIIDRIKRNVRFP